MNKVKLFRPAPRWRSQTVATCAVAVLFAASAHAARPLNTDDANIVDAKACQVESWVKTGRDVTERWVVPGCRFMGELEVSLGGGSVSDRVAGDARSAVAQAKYRWKAIDAGAFGVATTVGVVRQKPDVLARAFDDSFLSVPVTVALGQERFIHGNAGWLRHGDTGLGRATWGLAAEVPLSTAVIAVAETYGEQGSAARGQVGLRFWVIPSRVQIDTTVGNLLTGGSNTRWVSIGLRLLSPPFLP